MQLWALLSDLYPPYLPQSGASSFFITRYFIFLEPVVKPMLTQQLNGRCLSLPVLLLMSINQNRHCKIITISGTHIPAGF